MTFGRVFVLLGVAVLGIYLFVTAPPPLPEKDVTIAERSVAIAEVFNTLDAINAEARKIYTAEIVGRGSAVGLKFGEDWYKEGIDKGPFPALFMRLIADKLQKKSPRIGLFLGSDKPISPSNLFKGEQRRRFQAIKATREPQKFSMPDGVNVAMYADVASAKACVTCHNEHADTPKKDWKLHDVMGATTWTFERGHVTADEYRRIVAVIYEAVRESYADYLAKTRLFDNPPQLGEAWPGSGDYVLPNLGTFMAAVFAATGSDSLIALLTAGEAKLEMREVDAVASIKEAGQ